MTERNYSLNEARQIAVNRFVSIIDDATLPPEYALSAATLILKVDLDDEDDGWVTDDDICDDCADAEIFNSADPPTNDDKTECFLGVQDCPFCAMFGPSFLRISIPE